MSPAFPLSWNTDTIEGTSTALIVVSGELDRLTSPALRDHVGWCLATGSTRVVLDTHDVSFADAGAHRLLTELGQRAWERGCAVVVSSPSRSLRRLFDLVGVPLGIAIDEWSAA